jgi:hypothetical protein
VSTSQLIAIPAILLSIGMLVYLPRRRSASPESSKRR